jgi:hypothetical protein
MWPAIEPRCESVDIERRSCGKVWEPSFGQSHIPAVPQPKGTNTLRERPCNTGTLRVFRWPCCGVLLVPERLQRLMFVLRLQGHMARVRLRLGPLLPRLTVPPILLRELDTDNWIVPPIVPCTPRGAGVAPWPGDLLGRPINVKLPDIVGVLVLRLP